MTVALALLLGLPESVHYVTSPAQRSVQIARMPLDIDWCFAELLGQGRCEITRVFQTLVDEPESGSGSGLLIGEPHCLEGKAGV